MESPKPVTMARLRTAVKLCTFFWIHSGVTRQLWIMPGWSLSTRPAPIFPPVAYCGISVPVL